VAAFATCPPPWIGSSSSADRLAPGIAPGAIMLKATTSGKYKRFNVNLIEFIPLGDEEVCAIAFRPPEKAAVFTIIGPSAQGE
jgi:hypothetical protein